MAKEIVRRDHDYYVNMLRAIVADIDARADEIIGNIDRPSAVDIKIEICGDTAPGYDVKKHFNARMVD